MRMIRFFCLLGTVTLLSCSQPTGGNDDLRDDSSSLIDRNASVLYIAEADIGPGGGTVDIDGQDLLLVPAGALKDTVHIRIGFSKTPDTSQAITGISTIREILICEPEGLEFGFPATLIIPQLMEVAPIEEQSVYLMGEGGSWSFHSRDSAPENGDPIETEIHHFSVYGLSCLSQQGLESFHEDRASLSEAELANRAASFVEDNGLIGLKRSRNGTVYEVCGVEVDVMYAIGDIQGQYQRLFGERSDISDPMSSGFDFMNGETQEVVSTLVTVYWKPAEDEVWKIAIEADIESDTNEFTHFYENYGLTALVESEISGLTLQGNAEITLPYNEWGMPHAWYPEEFADLFSIPGLDVDLWSPQILTSVIVGLDSFERISTANGEPMAYSHDVECPGTTQADITAIWSQMDRILDFIYIERSVDADPLFNYLETVWEGTSAESTDEGNSWGFSIDVSEFHLTGNSHQMTGTFDTYPFDGDALVTLTKKQ